MLRHYYMTNDLDELVTVEKELLDNGFTKPQMHVLSEDDAEVHLHHLHEVESVLKKDVVHSTEIGAIIGFIGALLVLGSAYLFNWTDTAAGWVPFIFLAIVVLGFCTWEGGLIGIQEPNVEFKRFQKHLAKGKHIFFVDTNKEQEPILTRLMKRHRKLKDKGTGEATPTWVVRGQDKYNDFMNTMP